MCAGPPEEVYATQIQQLQDMGFYDVQVSARARCLEFPDSRFDVACYWSTCVPCPLLGPLFECLMALAPRWCVSLVGVFGAVKASPGCKGSKQSVVWIFMQLTNRRMQMCTRTLGQAVLLTLARATESCMYLIS